MGCGGSCGCGGTCSEGQGSLGVLLGRESVVVVPPDTRPPEGSKQPLNRVPLPQTSPPFSDPDTELAAPTRPGGAPPPPPPVPEDPPPPGKKGGGGGEPGNCPCECKCKCVAGPSAGAHESPGPAQGGGPSGGPVTPGGGGSGAAGGSTTPGDSHAGSGSVLIRRNPMLTDAINWHLPTAGAGQGAVEPPAWKRLTNKFDRRWQGEGYRAGQPAGPFIPSSSGFAPNPVYGANPYKMFGAIGAAAGAGAGPKAGSGPSAGQQFGLSGGGAAGGGAPQLVGAPPQAARLPEAPGAMWTPPSVPPEFEPTFGADAMPASSPVALAEIADLPRRLGTGGLSRFLAELPIAPADSMRASRLPAGSFDGEVVSAPAAGSFHRGGSRTGPGAGIGARGAPGTGDGSVAAGVNREAARTPSVPPATALSAALPGASFLAQSRLVSPAQQGIGSFDRGVTGAGTVPPHSISGPGHGAPAPYPQGANAAKSPLGASLAAGDQAPDGGDGRMASPEDPKAMRPPGNPRPGKVGPDSSQRGKGGGGIAAYAAAEIQDEASRKARDETRQSLDKAQATLDRLKRNNATLDALKRKSKTLHALRDDKYAQKAAIATDDLKRVAEALLENAVPHAQDDEGQRLNRESVYKAAEKELASMSRSDQDFVNSVLVNENAKAQAVATLAGGDPAKRAAQEEVDRADQDQQTKAVQLAKQLGLAPEKLKEALKDPKSRVWRLVDQEKDRQGHQAEQQRKRDQARADRTRYGEFRAQADAALRSSRASRDRANSAHNDLARLKHGPYASTYAVKEGNQAAKDAATASKAAKLLAKRAKDATESGNAEAVKAATEAAHEAAQLAGATANVAEAAAKAATLLATPPKDGSKKSVALHWIGVELANADLAKAKLDLAITKKPDLSDPKQKEELAKLQFVANGAEAYAQYKIDMAFAAGDIDLADTTWPHCPSAPHFPEECCDPACDAKKGFVAHRWYVNKCTGESDPDQPVRPSPDGVKGKGTNAEDDPHATRDSDPGAHDREPLPPIPPKKTETPPGQRGPDAPGTVTTATPPQKTASLKTPALPEASHAAAADEITPDSGNSPRVLVGAVEEMEPQAEAEWHPKEHGPRREITEEDRATLASLLLGSTLPDALSRAFEDDPDAFERLLKDPSVTSALDAILSRNQRLQEIGEDIADAAQAGVPISHTAVAGELREMARIHLVQERDTLEILWKAAGMAPTGYLGEPDASGHKDPEALRRQVAAAVGTLIAKAEVLDMKDQIAASAALSAQGRHYETYMSDLPALNSHKATLFRDDSKFRAMLHEITASDDRGGLLAVANRSAAAAHDAAFPMTRHLDVNWVGVATREYEHLDREPGSLLSNSLTAIAQTLGASSTHFVEGFVAPFVGAYDAIRSSEVSAGKAALASAWAPVNVLVRANPIGILFSALEATKQTLGEAVEGTGTFQGTGQSEGALRTLGETVLATATAVEFMAMAEGAYKGVKGGVEFLRRRADVHGGEEVASAFRVAEAGGRRPLWRNPFRVPRYPWKVDPALTRPGATNLLTGETTIGQGFTSQWAKYETLHHEFVHWILTPQGSSAPARYARLAKAIFRQNSASARVGEEFLAEGWATWNPKAAWRLATKPVYRPTDFGWGDWVIAAGAAFGIYEAVSGDE